MPHWVFQRFSDCTVIGFSQTILNFLICYCCLIKYCEGCWIFIPSYFTAFNLVVLSPPLPVSRLPSLFLLLRLINRPLPQWCATEHWQVCDRPATGAACPSQGAHNIEEDKQTWTCTTHFPPLPNLGGAWQCGLSLHNRAGQTTVCWFNPPHHTATTVARDMSVLLIWSVCCCCCHVVDFHGLYLVKTTQSQVHALFIRGHIVHFWTQLRRITVINVSGNTMFCSEYYHMCNATWIAFH